MGLATLFIFKLLPRLGSSGAEDSPVRLALLADAHLKNGNPSRPEARALARAVADIRALEPVPDLVLFAGDLAHNSHPGALALGKEILSDLPSPLLLVRGEGDGVVSGPDTWSRLFGEPRFACTLPGAHILGLNTVWRSAAHGPVFALDEAERGWLARELALLDPHRLLILLSHAPLIPVFQPWQQWTADAHRLWPLLACFRQVLCLHGHVHQGSEIRKDQGWDHERWGEFSIFRTGHRKPETKHLSIPATAWPLPSPLQGTPRRLRPGLTPHGCGWSLLGVKNRFWHHEPHLWA